jgi:mycothione reductase
MSHYDLVVIGSGSGNSVITEQMAGWRIAMVEESTFGGTCLNVGCIPTKMFVYTADVADSIRRSSQYGVDAHIDDVRWRDIRDRVFDRIDPISAGGERYRMQNHTLHKAHATFTGPRQLQLSSGEHLSADRIVIATGSRVDVPPEVTASGVPFHTSDTVMRLDELPARLIILGGGYIAAEFAHVFSALGVQVTIVCRGPALLRRLDEEISARFTMLAKQRWAVHTDAKPEALSLTGNSDGVSLQLADGIVIDADLLLVATGRVPNTDRLGLDLAGVDVDSDGLVVVDEYQRSTADGVWALGDASSADQLKHVANQDARIVAHNLSFPDDLKVSNHRFIPSAVFTDPQLAGVGLTEQDARAKGIPYVSAVQEFGSTAYGWAMQDTTGICKLLADPDTGKLLGAHLLGPQSSSLIQPLIQAMTFEQRVTDVARNQYWIHPALAEVVENALLKLTLD